MRPFGGEVARALSVNTPGLSISGWSTQGQERLQYPQLETNTLIRIHFNLIYNHFQKEIKSSFGIRDLAAAVDRELAKVVEALRRRGGARPQRIELGFKRHSQEVRAQHLRV